MTTPIKSIKSTWCQQTLNNFDNFDFFYTKLSGIDPSEKPIDMLDGLATCFYIVKQACGNEIMPSV